MAEQSGPSSISLDPSRLPGNHRTRVFIGGSYADQARPLLDELSGAVMAEQFDPIIADRYQLLIPVYDIHDVTLYLLHSCRLAIFEASAPSGALMEIERATDYGTRCLILRYGKALPLSRMLTSLVMEHDGQLRIFDYDRPRNAVAEAQRWLRTMRRMTYDRHSI